MECKRPYVLGNCFRFSSHYRRVASAGVWPHFWGVQLWSLILLLVYCAFRALVRVIGRERIMHVYFRPPSKRLSMRRAKLIPDYSKITLFALFACLVSTASAQETGANTQPLNNGNDLTRPTTRFDLRYNFQDKGGGIRQDQFILRLDQPIPLAEGWTIATRFDLPFVLSNNPGSDNPKGRYTFGTGDFLAEAVLVHSFTERFACGAGLRVLFPTASEDQFGAGKYQLIPIAAVRYFVPEISEGSYLEPVVRYASDVGGYGGRKHISQLQMGPKLNVAFPKRWFVTLFPSQDIVLNTIGGHKWFVPADFSVGRNLTRNTVASLEISIPVIRQFTLYDFKLEARLSHSF